MAIDNLYRRRPNKGDVEPRISRVAARKSNGQFYNNIGKALVALLGAGAIVYGGWTLSSPTGDVAPNNNLNPVQSQNAENPYNNDRYNQIETSESTYKIVTPQASGSPQTPSNTKTLESRLESSPVTPPTKSTDIDQTVEQGTAKPKPYVGGGSDIDSENVKRDILARTQPATPPTIDSAAKDYTPPNPAVTVTPDPAKIQAPAATKTGPSITSTPAVITPVTLADLVFGKVSYTAGGWDKDYIRGKDYRVQVIVSNNGNAQSGPFYISASSLEQKLRFDGISPGKNLSTTIDLKLLAGDHNLNVVVEPEDRTKEKGDNNSSTLSITVPEPPFKFVWDGSMPEQFNTYRKNALEDYRKVLALYGIKEEEARMIVLADKEGYSINFIYNGKVGGAVGMGLNDFIKDRREVAHEMSHAINHTLFPTKNSDEAWYNSFDEGSAMKASGEIENAKQTSTLLREDNGSLKNYNWMAAIELLVSNPNKFWKEVEPPDNPGWLTGQVLFLLLEREGLTLEMHTKALKILADLYKEPNLLTNRGMIQTAYERAMGKSLSYTFKLLEPGIDRFYGTRKSSGLLPGQIYATFQREETGKDGKPITVTYKITNPAA